MSRSRSVSSSSPQAAVDSCVSVMRRSLSSAGRWCGRPSRRRAVGRAHEQAHQRRAGERLDEHVGVDVGAHLAALGGDREPVVEALPGRRRTARAGRGAASGSAAISAISPGSAARGPRGARTPPTYAAASRRRSSASDPVSGSDSCSASVGERRLVHQVGLARPAAVDRGLAGAGPLGDRGDRQVGVPDLHRPARRPRAARRRRCGGSAGDRLLLSLRDHRNVKGATDGRSSCQIDDLAGPAVHARGRGDPVLHGPDGRRLPARRRASLHDKARAETGLDDFGPEDYRERLDAVRRRRSARSTACTARASSTSTCSCSRCSRTGCCSPTC